MFKSTITKDIEAKAKNKNQKKETNMKNNSTKIVVLTLLATVVVLGALAFAFKTGMDYNQSITNRVHAEAKALGASVVVVPPSKQ